MELKNKTILLVEDDQLIGEMYETKLKIAGARVIRASNGEEGLDKLKKETVDLIITDLMMPRIGGYEMLQRLKKSREDKDIPVIILTNLTDRPEDTKKIKELGVADYIIKSNIHLKDLIKKIAILLREKDKKKIKDKKI